MASVFPETSPTGDTDETMRVWRTFWEAQEVDFPNPPDDSWKARLWQTFEDHVDPDLVLHNVPNCHDRATWGAFGEALGVAYPDSETTYDLIVAEGDWVMAWWTYRGTHLRPLGDHPATGKSIKVFGVMATRVKDGKIVEQWSLIDQLDWLKQLGAVDGSLNL